jgi:class 3 adenylate cyclase/tetratricopeptide (TPR) repeat protein
VLFVDLEGFTSLSERRDAEDVRELLSSYFDASRRVVERYGGTVEKYIGDAVMAVWGSPVAREDDAERAVRAALDVVEAVAGLAETTGIATLRARAGVVTGQAASWGASGEGLVVGDRVNTAARIQALAEPGSVLVDDATRHASLASIAYADAGLHAVKGRVEPVHVWRAMRVVAGASGHDRADGLEARFVGRDAELRLVKDLFHSSAERRQARMALVVGAAGSGKSRLLSEFSRYTDGLADDTFWHVGRCLSYGEGVAFWALAEAVRQRFGIPEEAPDAEAEQRLDAGIARYVPDQAEGAYLRPRLAALLGLPGGEGLDRQDLMAGWRTFFQRLAERDPVILVLEDLQWADSALLDFVDHLLEWAAQDPIFVLGLARPELLERRTSWVAGRRNLSVLWLDRLSDASVGDLLDDLVPGMPGEVRGRIVSRAEGVPLFAVESVRSLVDRGLVVARDGRYVLEGPVADLDVPPSLTSLLASRLDGLEPDERAIAMRMSVFGGGFSRDAVLAVADVPEGRVDAALAGLVRREVLSVRSDRLSPDRGQYVYAQGLLRQVAFDMLGKRERKARHLAAADHLTATFAEGADVGEVLASHYRGAYDAVPDDPDAPTIRRLAHHAYLRAGERALALGSPDVAERSFAVAATLTDGSERTVALLRAADAALAAGRTDRALDGVQHVLEGPDEPSPSQWAEAMLLAARAHGDERRATELLAVTEANNNRFPQPTEHEVQYVAPALSRRARSLIAVGELDEAAATLDRALRLAEWVGDQELVADGLIVHGTLMMVADRPLEASVSYEGALRWATDPVAIDTLRNNLGDVALQTDAPEAVGHFEAVLERARQRGDRSGESIAVINLALVDLARGAWERARDASAEMVRVLEEWAYPAEAKAFPRVLLGAVARFRGDGPGLAEQLAALRETAVPEDMMDLGLQRWLELMHDSIRGADVSEQLVEQASASLVLGMRTEWFRYVWVDALGEARAQGRPDLVDQLLAMVADRPEGSMPPFLRAQAARYRGLRALDSGDVAQARALLGRTVDVLDGLEYPYWAACARLDLALAVEASGEPAGAEGLRDAARGVLAGLGAGHVLAGGPDARARGAHVGSAVGSGPRLAGG